MEIFSLEFSQNITKTIKLIGSHEQFISDEDLFELLIEYIIPYKEAIEIITFLPVAFCRKLLPTLKWTDTYFELIEGKEQVEKKFSQTKSYNIIMRETIKYFSDKPDNSVVLKIASRSSDFHAINQFLNAGGSLEDIKFTPIVLMR